MINVQENILLAPYTTLKMGGPARYFVEVNSIRDLEEAVGWAKKNIVQYHVIAGGSNLLVSDKGFVGLIIKLNFSGISETNGVVNVKAGTQLQELVDYTIEKGLDGMSTMTGIPGSVGGAVYGSAGAYGDNIRDYIVDITYFNGDEIMNIPIEKFDSGYRDSIFKKNKDWIILEVKFANFLPGNVEELKKEAGEVLEKRAKKYNPALKTPGSFFKNVPEEKLTPDELAHVRSLIGEWEKTIEYKERFGDSPVIRFGKIPAGTLIDMLGGRGDQIGQIKIDDYHANTIINLGDGKPSDFFAMAKKWKDKVRKEFKIELEPEVQFIGFDQKDF